MKSQDQVAPLKTMPSGSDSSSRRRSIHEAIGQQKRDRITLQNVRLAAVEQNFAVPVAAPQSSEGGYGVDNQVRKICMDPARAKWELLVQPNLDGINDCAEQGSTGGDDRSARRSGRLLAAFSIVACAIVAFFIYDSYSLDRLMTDGDSKVAKGQAGKAVEILSSAIGKSPRSARAFLHRGIAVARTGDYQQALGDLTSAVRLGADKSVALSGRALVYLRMHEYDKAIEDCTSALFDDPNNADCLEVRAVCYAHKEDFAHAIEDCNSALRVGRNDQQRTRLLRERGVALSREHASQAALADLSAVLKDNKCESILLQRAEIYRSRQMFSQAIADCTEVLQLNPHCSQALVARGICMAKMQRNAEAIHDFTAALFVDGTCVEAYIQRGTLYMNAQEWAMAECDFRRALELNPYIAEAGIKADFAHDRLYAAVLSVARKHAKPG